MTGRSIMQHGWKARARRGVAAVIAAAAVSIAAPAFAACTSCECIVNNLETTREGVDPRIDRRVTIANIRDQHDVTREYIDKNFKAQEDYFEERIKNALIPQLMRMAEHFTSVGMYQALIIGTYFDGLRELNGQRLFNTLTAEAHRDYQPSIGICVMGTGIRSLAASERKGEYARYVLSQRSQDRQLGHRNALGADGLHYDLRARLALFKTRYCDLAQNSEGMAELCDASAPVATRNRDMDYGSLIDQPMTLDVDFTEPRAAASEDEQDIFNLADNLYANNLQTRMPPANFDYQYSREKILDLRSLVAKRSVAENAFNSIVALKALGSADDPDATPGDIPAISSTGTTEYMKVILKQLGIPDEEIDGMLGVKDRDGDPAAADAVLTPSYFAQMNVLTKLIYQRPEFYADLYDTEANVKRKSAAMQAIELMQNFDLWDSYLRQESMLSIWLELDLKKHEDAVRNRVDRIQNTDRTLQ